MRKEKRKIIFFGFLFLLDRISKYLALERGFAVINPGISFGIMLPFALIVPVVLTVIYLVVKSRFGLGGGMIIGGGLSNLIDRFFYGGAVDFIKIPPAPVFNFSDILIVSGVVVLLVDLGRSQKVS